jgi:thymidine phosphorylase
MTDELMDRIRLNNFDEGDPEVRGLLRNAAFRGLLDEEIIRLIRAIAGSSDPQWSSFPGGATDLPSTGGPSGISTLVVPILVALMGERILKVSAAGRPAGAIDTLQTLPGYQAHLSASAAQILLAKSGYVHVAQAPDLAPADEKLIQIRRLEGAMASPDLAIASLLSKKVCVGLKTFVLDVRVGASGNVSRSVAGALKFSKRFVRIANLLGITARCVITDLRDLPQTPYIGRGESLLGLEAVLTGVADPRTARHIMELCLEVFNLSHPNVSHTEARETFLAVLKKNPLQEVSNILHFHGVPSGAFTSRLEELKNFKELPIVAEDDGWVCTVDLDSLKDTLQKLYFSLPVPDHGTPPWEVGIRWLLSDRLVQRGQTICNIRVRDSFEQNVRPYMEHVSNTIRDAIRLHDAPPPGDQMVSGVVISVINEKGIERGPVAPV